MELKYIESDIGKKENKKIQKNKCNVYNLLYINYNYLCLMALDARKMTT